MSHVIEFIPAAVDQPGGPGHEDRDPGIRTDAVYVVYTSVEDTLEAVRVAGGFAKPLGLPVTLVHFRTVPYPLPVEHPSGISPVETEAFLARLRAEHLEVSVHVHLCRDARQAMPMAFKPHALIVVAGRHGVWPTRPGRLCRTLEAAGHFVVFVNPSQGSVRRPVRKGRSHA